MGAMGSEYGDEFTKDKQNKVFVHLLLVCGLTVLILLITAFLFYNPLANILYPL